ncbi:MAG: glycosyltransferase [bacterium]
MPWETRTSGAHTDWQRRISKELAGKRVFDGALDLACDFSIVIVNYNVREFLRQMLLSLRPALRPLRAEIFVVDNASDDGSVDMVQSQFPECTVLANEENLGFAAANNLALRRARGRYLVLLNPDTVVQEDTFTALREFMNHHPHTGMAGCRVLNPDGTLQLACRRSFPTPWVAFTKLSGLSRLFPRSRWFGRYNLTFLPEDETCEVEAISGSFMVARRETVEQVGLLDEDFFMYGEDLDWCYRIRSAGWQIHYYPGTQIVHFKGESSRRSSFDSLRLFYQSMGLFVQKHFRRRMFVLSYWFLHLAIWVRAAIAFAKTLFSAVAIPLVDLSLMQLSLGVAIWLRFESNTVWPKYLIVDAVYSTVWLACLAVFGCNRRARFSAYQALIATVTGFLINASFTFFFKQYAFSRQVVLIAGVLNVFLLTAWRLAVKTLYYLGVAKFAQVAGHTVRGLRTVVVGDFNTDSSLVERLKMNVNGNYELVGLVCLEAAHVGQSFAGVPVIAALDDLDELLHSPARHRIEQVIFSTHRVTYDRIIGAMSRQRKQRISFKLAPSQLDVIIGKSSIDAIAAVPLVEIKNRLSLFWPRLSKRILDVSLAVVALLIFFPMFMWHWLKARRFENLEVAGMQPRLHLRYLPAGGRAGKWLWFWAILRGRLSWVGRELTAAPTEQSRSKQIGLRPGITGLAQVHRPGVLSAEEKDKYYLYYVTHYSPLLDVEILFRATFRI